MSRKLSILCQDLNAQDITIVLCADYICQHEARCSPATPILNPELEILRLSFFNPRIGRYCSQCAACPRNFRGTTPSQFRVDA